MFIYTKKIIHFSDLICSNFKLSKSENIKYIINISIVFLILFIFSCKKKPELDKISDYKEFNRMAASLTCEKIRVCYNYIYRTFPRKLLKTSRVEDCENHILLNLDDKLNEHNQKIQILARTCYTEVLNTPCKTLPMAVLSNPSCTTLKKEIEKNKK